MNGLGLALTAFFVVGWLTIFFLRVERGVSVPAQPEPGEQFWIFVALGTLSTHFTVAGIVLTTWSDVRPLSGALAAGVFLAGVGLWLWGRAAIGPVRQLRPPGAPPRRLRRDGPFGIVRHPLYLGILTASLAPIVAAPTLVFVPTYAACLAALVVRSLQEERRLHVQLGPDYADYCREVRRLIPFVW